MLIRKRKSVEIKIRLQNKFLNKCLKIAWNDGTDGSATVVHFNVLSSTTVTSTFIKYNLSPKKLFTKNSEKEELRKKIA